MKTNNLLQRFGALLILPFLSRGEFEVPRFRGYAINGYNPVFIPRRGKFKGWMREKRRCTFNKNR